MKKKISQLSIEIDFSEFSEKLEAFKNAIDALNDAMKGLESVKEIPFYADDEEDE